MSDRSERRKRQATVIRRFRRIHRYSGIFLFVFYFIIGITSVLLGWKKDSGDFILPKTRKGISADMQQWLPLDSLGSIAVGALPKGFTLDRVDVRPDKGIAKFQFAEKNTEVQVDAASGEVLHVGRRHADLIEGIHDGSYVDELIGTGGVFKVIYSTTTGLALIVFTISGFWLWYGPKRMRA